MPALPQLQMGFFSLLVYAMSNPWGNAEDCEDLYSSIISSDANHLVIVIMYVNNYRKYVLYV